MDDFDRFLDGVMRSPVEKVERSWLPHEEQDELIVPDDITEIWTRIRATLVSEDSHNIELFTRMYSRTNRKEEHEFLDYAVLGEMLEDNLFTHEQLLTMFFAGIRASDAEVVEYGEHGELGKEDFLDTPQRFANLWFKYIEGLKKGDPEVIEYIKRAVSFAERPAELTYLAVSTFEDIFFNDLLSDDQIRELHRWSHRGFPALKIAFSHMWLWDELEHYPPEIRQLLGELGLRALQNE